MKVACQATARNLRSSYTSNLVKGWILVQISEWTCKSICEKTKSLLTFLIIKLESKPHSTWLLWVRFQIFDVIPLFPLLSFWIHRFLNFENSILVNLANYSFFMRSSLNKLIHRNHVDFTPLQLCSNNFGLRPFICSQTDLQVHSGACWIRVFQLETLMKLCFWQL